MGSWVASDRPAPAGMKSKKPTYSALTHKQTTYVAHKRPLGWLSIAAQACNASNTRLELKQWGWYRSGTAANGLLVLKMGGWTARGHPAPWDARNTCVAEDKLIVSEPALHCVLMSCNRNTATHCVMLCHVNTAIHVWAQGGSPLHLTR